MTVVLGGTAAFGCSGTNQLVGSDGLSVGGGNFSGASSGGGNSGGGNIDGGQPRAGGSASASEPVYELWQIVTGVPNDDQPYKCMPEPLPLDATGNADCYVLSTRHDADCNCAAAGLSPTSAEITRAARRRSKLAGWCDTSINGPCASVCVCEVDPAVGASLQQCQTEAEPDASTTGWCYVAAAAGDAQSALVESCPSRQPQRLRFFGPVTDMEPEVEDPALRTEMLFLGCPFVPPVAPVGDPCISADEYRLDFPGYSVEKVTIQEQASMCESGICLQNHFQGRASCRDGQAEGGGDCFAAGSSESVTVPVAPQLGTRQAQLTSICSCQCAGPGPGPYCTCSERTQCEHLIDDSGTGDNHLAGSYCIPYGTRYQPNGND